MIYRESVRKINKFQLKPLIKKRYYEFLPILFLFILFAVVLFQVPNTYAFKDTFCPTAPFEDYLGASWMSSVSICFPNHNGTVFMNEQVPFHVVAEVYGNVTEIRLYIFHSAESHTFDPNGPDYQKLLNSEKPPYHVVGIYDNLRIFGINLNPSSRFHTVCQQWILSKNSTTEVKNPQCSTIFEGDESLQFTEPGVYYYSLTIETDPNSTKPLENFRQIPVFTVPDYNEQLAIESHYASINQQNNPLIDFFSSVLGQVIAGLILAALVGWFAMKKRSGHKDDENGQRGRLIDLDSGLDLERFFEGMVQFIRVRNTSPRTIQNCLVLCNDEPCRWWDNNQPLPRNIYSGGGANARLNIAYVQNPKITIKSGNNVIRELPLNEISLGVA